MSLKNLGDVTYFRLNNEINRPIGGKIPLHKDKEAVQAFYRENVVPNTMQFDDLKSKLDYLIKENYIEQAFLEQYSFHFLEKLYNDLVAENFEFKSFMAAYKFYQQYALKTNDGAFYLETFTDRVFFNALYMAAGNEDLARNLAFEILNQRYQPATPTFLNAGRARRGNLVSCFLLSVADDLSAIGRSINSALQLSKGGGGVGEW